MTRPRAPPRTAAVRVGGWLSLEEFCDEFGVSRHRLQVVRGGAGVGPVPAVLPAAQRADPDPKGVV